MTAPLRAHDDMTGAAFAALKALSRAVAVFGRDGGVIVSNPCFDALFGTEASLRILNDTAGEGVRDLRLPDGRTLRVETATLPQGRLVTADDISETVDAQMRAEAAARTDALTGLGN